MLLWFIGLGFAATVFAFRSPALDYRVVVAGLVVPLLDVVTGTLPLLHTLAAPVLGLACVMLVTRRRRLVRRRWLGLPIGMFVHLVLAGSWSSTELFWWPLAGRDIDALGFASLWRGGWGLGMELAGAAAIVWSVRRLELASPANRDLLLREGRLNRELLG